MLVGRLGVMYVSRRSVSKYVCLPARPLARLPATLQSYYYYYNDTNNIMMYAKNNSYIVIW